MDDGFVFEGDYEGDDRVEAIATVSGWITTQVRKRSNYRTDGMVRSPDPDIYNAMVMDGRRVAGFANIVVDS